MPAYDETGLDQMLMSQGAYFGQNSTEILELSPLYGELHQHYVSHKRKKEKYHLQPLGEFMGGYCEEGPVVIFFIGTALAEMEDCRQIGSALSRFVREEEANLWLQKIV